VDDNFGFKGDIEQLHGETDDPGDVAVDQEPTSFSSTSSQQAHAMGFKVICDGVFNHVGKGHPFFVDCP
jgi:hypothetical protein